MKKQLYFLILVGLLFMNDAHANNGIEPSSIWYPKVAPIIQHSCSQCHVAKENGKRGMAARKFDLTDFLATKKIALSDTEMSMLEKVIQKGSMPPKPYIWFHSGSKVSDADKDVILSWIKATKPD